MKNKDLVSQIIKFIIVGGVAFVIDYMVLIFCKDYIFLSTFVSTALAFSISVVYNYIASVKWVFIVSNDVSSKKNFIIFILLSFIGLVLTEIIMIIGSDFLKVEYKMIKLFATFIVMVFNFITRKKFLEE